VTEWRERGYGLRKDWLEISGGGRTQWLSRC
jgi:hypothetical protein